MTSFNPGERGSTVLRVYEAEGKATSHFTIKLNARVISASEANLLEDAGQKLVVRENTVSVDLHPFEIKTIKFRLATVAGRR